ncbi:hypothetical protein AGMMS49992_10990 [Clostridia bacterium]|nr:hypothetical protein AGMMS49992_10990 [Clostridia bacterium]
MSYSWVRKADQWQLHADGASILSIPFEQGCEDTFEPIANEPGAWRWTRVSAQPVDAMNMTIHTPKARYWLVPAVNYNGNGWGTGAQYGGDMCDGVPWRYVWHRVAVPAMTYTENDAWSVSLFGEESGGMSCSLFSSESQTTQQLLWPEAEAPKTLYKRFWGEALSNPMEPATQFTGILYVAPSEELRMGIRGVLDFAWRLSTRPVSMQFSPEELIRLDTLYFRQLWRKKYDGLTGFSGYMHWDESQSAFIKSNTFEIGWTGQNASISCMLLKEYLKTGEESLRDKALSVLDSWMKYAPLGNGLILCNLTHDPNHTDSAPNGDIPVDLDACNLGVGATYLFKAAKLAEQCGTPRPRCQEVALGICDFALCAQHENGEFAKSWFLDGTVNAAHGTVGSFLILPLFDAYALTQEKKYLDCALKAFAFYYGEFARTGATTAGALDSNCIDKESAAPMIRAALYCYHTTMDRAYVDAAEDIAYYLATWMWTYSVKFPEGTLAQQMGYDTFGGTSVSAAHCAQDMFGLYWVPEYLELAELTGKPIWKERARALWYNGLQMLSDGTLVINGRVRPAGGQDESMRHTWWGKADKRCFVPSELLTVWQGIYRQVALEKITDWEILR